MLLTTMVACEGPPKDPPVAEVPVEDAYTPAQDACEAMAGGAAAEDDPALGLSRLHAAVRLFRPSKDWLAADQALIDAVGGETWDPGDALTAYAPAVGGCVVDAVTTTLAPAWVEVVGATAVVHPGTAGDLAIPDDATLLVLDLRGLPAGADTATALDSALAAVISGDLDLGGFKVRAFVGYPGIGGEGGVYSAALSEQDWVVTGTAAVSRPLVVLTEAALAPEVARVAGALRLSQAAWIVGHPVWAQAAEASWAAVGDRGVAWPSRNIHFGSDDWPDIVPADVESAAPEEAIADAAAWGAPPAVSGSSSRDPMARAYAGDTDTPLDTLDRGSARAMLLVAHGLVDRFYPYFDVVGYDHDDALVAGLLEVDALAEGDRVGVLHALGRFMHATEDGHGFFGDWAGTDYLDSHLALQIEDLDGSPVVRTSGYPEVAAGDRVVEIEGVSAGDWYADAMAWHSAATPGYLFEVSGREWVSQVASANLVVRGADGVEREVTLAGMVAAESQALVPWGGTLRPSGWLDDLGGENLYLLNLNGSVTTTDAQWRSALEEAAGADGLIVDMRDYPGFNHYTLAQALRSGAFQSPTFRVPTWDGPDLAGVDESVYDMTGSADYTGPIVLLVSNKTVSAAENFSMMLWGAENVTVIGQQSAGTNGNITSAYLPGGYYMYFTGMKVLNPDGSGLHGVGIPLDVEVVPTAEDYAAGVDPELQAAMEWLSP